VAAVLSSRGTYLRRPNPHAEERPESVCRHPAPHPGHPVPPVFRAFRGRYPASSFFVFFCGGPRWPRLRGLALHAPNAERQWRRGPASNGKWEMGDAIQIPAISEIRVTQPGIRHQFHESTRTGSNSSFGTVSVPAVLSSRGTCELVCAATPRNRASGKASSAILLILSSCHPVPPVFRASRGKCFPFCIPSRVGT